MRLLLDTHTIIWMVTDDPRLSTIAREAILEADHIYWSMASLWEIAIKSSLDRVDFQLMKGWEKAIPEELKRNRIEEISLSSEHLSRVATLPFHHRDPFDRLLIATAQAEDLQIVTTDLKLSHYDVNVIY